MWAALLFNKTTAWLLVALSLCAGGFAMGWKARKPQVDRAQARLALCEASRTADAAEAARCQAETEARAQESVAKAEAEVRAAKAKVVVVTKEVIRYVETSSPLLPDAVPWGVVCATDAAARGDSAGLAGAPCNTPGAPSPFADSDLARVTVENYGRYHDCEAKLLGWQKWYEDLRSSWNKPP